MKITMYNICMHSIVLLESLWVYSVFRIGLLIFYRHETGLVRFW